MRRDLWRRKREKVLTVRNKNQASSFSCWKWNLNGCYQTPSILYHPLQNTDKVLSIWHVCTVPANLQQNCAELWSVPHMIWVPQLCHFDVWVYIRQTVQKNSYKENKDHFLCSLLAFWLSVLNCLRLPGCSSQHMAGCNR